MSKKSDYLTLCSIAAQKAGTSYGKYMACTDTTRQFRPMWRTWKPRRCSWECQKAHAQRAAKRRYRGRKNKELEVHE